MDKCAAEINQRVKGEKVGMEGEDGVVLASVGTL